MIKTILHKIKESLFSVLPIYLIVVFLYIFNIVNLSDNTINEFFLSGIILVIGMALFNYGAETSMMQMGEKIGSKLIKRGKVFLLLGVCFILGIAITIAEPDLNVLAVLLKDAIPVNTTIITIAIGVGIFLFFAVLRVFLKIRLKYILILLYAIVFILVSFSSKTFLPVAFDSGGVTTGPVTVPFMMAIGVGVSSISNGKKSHDENFGMVALSSVGPIMAMLVLGIFSKEGAISNGVKESLSYWRLLVNYGKSVFFALLPIVIIFFLLQIKHLKLSFNKVKSIVVGVLINYIGLVLFLSAVEYGFMGVGTEIGNALGEMAIASEKGKIILVIVGFALGFFAVLAEPAVHVLNKLIEDTSGGIISRKSILISFTIGVGLAVAISMLRIIYDIDFMIIIGIGYIISLILSIVVDDIYVAIAYDSGGVASGPMSSSFILPLAIGVASSMGKDILTGAFGIVALIALTPLITIQILGLIVKIKTYKRIQYFTDDNVIIKM